MNRSLRFFLDACASFYGLLLLFPIYIFVLLIPSQFLPPAFIQPSEMVHVVAFGGLYLVSLAARACAWLCEKKWHMETMKRRLLCVLPALLCVALTFFAAYYFLSLYESIVLAVMAIPAFYLGSSLFFFSYDEVMSRKRLYLTFAFNGGALFLLLVTETPHNYTSLFALLLLVGILMQLFALNQGGMDNMMRMRRHRPELLPQKIRSYNFRLVLLVVVVLLIGVLLYQPLAGLVSAAGEGLLELIRTIVRFLSSLGGEDHEPPTVESEPPKQDPNLDGLMPGDGQGSPLWDYLTFFAIGIVILLLILNSDKLFRMLRDLFRRLFSQLSALLHRSRKRAESQITDEYTDVEEEVTVANMEPLVKENTPQPWLKWQLDYRRYRLMPPSEKRMRAGYRLTMAWLHIQQVPIQASHTTLEIAQITDESIRFAPLTNATTQYNLLRYGDRSYNLCNAAELDRLLNEMAHTKTAAKHSRLSRILKEESAR